MRIIDLHRKLNRNTIPNTFIGNLSSVLNSAQALATALGISSSYISYFAITGVDIEARINIDYNLPAGFVHSQNGNSNCTYFRDMEGKCQLFIGTRSFWYGDSMLDAYFPEVTNIGLEAFVNRNKYDRIYLPKCTIMGSSTGNESALLGAKSLTELTLPVFLQTANAGSEEGDVAAARSRGSIITYV